MADVLRLSQIVGLFGPGAMVDLPDRSVVVGGLDRWSWHPNPIKVIEEPRLSNLLEARLRDANDRRIAHGKPLQLREPPVQTRRCTSFRRRSGQRARCGVPNLVRLRRSRIFCNKSRSLAASSPPAVGTAGPPRLRRRLCALGRPYSTQSEASCRRNYRQENPM